MPTDHTPPEAPSAEHLRDQAWEAFQREFDTLHQGHARQWVAYHGPRRVCIQESDLAAYQKCTDEGLDPDEILVRFISPASLETDAFVSQPYVDEQSDS
jgi:hypothetical protein